MYIFTYPPLVNPLLLWWVATATSAFAFGRKCLHQGNHADRHLLFSNFTKYAKALL